MFVIEQHGWLEAEGIEAFAELQVSSKEGLADEVAVEEHFEEVVGIVVVEDHPFSVPSRVVGHVVDRAAPDPN